MAHGQHELADLEALQSELNPKEKAEPRQHGRQVTVALNNLHKRRNFLISKRATIDEELTEILEAIHALG